MGGFMTIAIDGPSASGKGTLARRLADHFHFYYLDTGALYRCVAKRILDNGGNPDDPEAGVSAAIFVRDHFDNEWQLDPALRNDVVADATSRVSKIPAVRDVLRDTQRDLAARPPIAPNHKPWNGSVLDGRDIGTVICPDAPLKFFVTASAEARARRRTLELEGRGIEAVYETVLLEMIERDTRDRTRAVAPTLPAADAVLLDTSDMTADDVFEKACSIVRQKMA